jgi:hypothetical protein
MLVNLRRERFADLLIAFVLRFVECFYIWMQAYFLVGFTMGYKFLRSKDGLQDQDS